MSKPIRVMIIDRHDMVRAALEMRLRYAGDLQILGSTGEYEHASEKVGHLAPDVVLLEVKAPGGLQALEAMRSAYPQCRVIVLTTYPDSREEDESLALGASRYLLKTLDTQDLVRQIRTVAHGA